MVHPHDQDLMDEIEGALLEDAMTAVPRPTPKPIATYDGIIWDTAMATLFRLQKARRHTSCIFCI